MGRKCSYIPAVVFMICMAAACGAEETETVEDRARGEMTQSQAFERFLDNELPVFFSMDGESGIYYEEYCSGGFVEEEEYEISRLDLDNDGKEELVIDSMGHYGTAVIDFRDGRLYFLAQGEGTAGICSYIFIPVGSEPGAVPGEFTESLADAAGTSTEEEAWIVHRDTSHAGRQMFWFEKYNGEGEVVDQFTLSAEYWEEPGDSYSEDSDFTYRDEKITMQEYEDLRRLYVGW